MKTTEFLSALNGLNLTQSDFAKMAGITTRTVNLWATGERHVAAPAEAYLGLLAKLPKFLFEAEKSEKLGEITMENGMYTIQFTGIAESGIGAIIFDNGVLFGIDEAGVKYDGVYSQSQNIGNFDLSLTVSVPAGVELVTGKVAHHSDFSFKIQNELPISKNVSFKQETMFGPVNVLLKHVRYLPN